MQVREILVFRDISWANFATLSKFIGVLIKKESVEERAFPLGQHLRCNYKFVIVMLNLKIILLYLIFQLWVGSPMIFHTIHTKVKLSVDFIFFSYKCLKSNIYYTFYNTLWVSTTETKTITPWYNLFLHCENIKKLKFNTFVVVLIYFFRRHLLQLLYHYQLPEEEVLVTAGMNARTVLTLSITFL